LSGIDNGSNFCGAAIDVIQSCADLHLFGNAADIEARVKRPFFADGKNHAVNRD